MYVLVDVMDPSSASNERIVQVRGAKGNVEEFLLPQRALEKVGGKSAVFIGGVLNSKNNEFLVEFPVESARGSWRVWVNEQDVVPSS